MGEVDPRAGRGGERLSWILNEAFVPERRRVRNSARARCGLGGASRSRRVTKRPPRLAHADGGWGVLVHRPVRCGKRRTATGYRPRYSSTPRPIQPPSRRGQTGELGGRGEMRHGEGDDRFAKALGLHRLLKKTHSDDRNAERVRRRRKPVGGHPTPGGGPSARLARTATESSPAGQFIQFERYAKTCSGGTKTTARRHAPVGSAPRHWGDRARAAAPDIRMPIRRQRDPAKRAAKGPSHVSLSDRSPMSASPARQGSMRPLAS